MLVTSVMSVREVRGRWFCHGPCCDSVAVFMGVIRMTNRSNFYPKSLNERSTPPPTLMVEVVGQGVKGIVGTL